MDTQYTSLNLTTSAAVYIANKFTETGWAIHWQATNITSGVATNGTVTLVPEFPDEPSNLILPVSGVAFTQHEVTIPAFTVQLSSEPVEEDRVGLGDATFESRARILIDGYVVDQAQHLAFATLFRNWFRKDTWFSVFDFETNPTSPPLIDEFVQINDRFLNRLEVVNVPRPVRYYLNLEVDISYFE